ncbi:MAG: hypothetical protein KGM98_10480, partial [Bacteroidota bacterium]|nr:hypothetical protein [Bacteroidota bacterium]
MALTILLYALTIAGTCSGQINTEQAPHQSIIVALICHDGILMAGDSRSAFITKGDSVSKKDTGSSIAYAYFDHTQKIFPLGKYLIGITGEGLAGKNFFSAIIQRFLSTHPGNMTITESFNALMKFIQTEYGISNPGLLQGTQFIMAGFEDDRPVIYGFSARGILSEKRIGGALESDGDF